jgi:hypothetical protein
LVFRVILNLTRFVLEPPNKLENHPFFSSSAGLEVVVVVVVVTGAGSGIAGSGIAGSGIAGSGIAVSSEITGAVADSSILSTELSSPSPPRCFL